MKNRSKSKVLILVFSLFCASVSFGQGVDKIAQTGLKWLSIPVGARPAAMASAYTAANPDPSAVFWNPAGLALTEGSHVFLNQTQWIADIDVNAFAISFSIGNLGTFGVHAAAVDWGVFNGTQFSGGEALFEETGTFSPDDFLIGVTYSRRVSDKFSFGANIRLVHEDLQGGLEGSLAAPEQFSATLDIVAVDFGTLFYTGYKDLRLGMTIQNISQEKKYRFESFPLPLTFRFGAAMDLARVFAEGSEDQNVTLSVDAINQRDFTERLQFGLEYGFRKMFFLRGGYKFNYDQEDVSLGAGVKLNVNNFDFGLDYGYMTFSDFDAVHMFSFDFGL